MVDAGEAKRVERRAVRPDGEEAVGRCVGAADETQRAAVDLDEARRRTRAADAAGRSAVGEIGNSEDRAIIDLRRTDVGAVARGQCRNARVEHDGAAAAFDRAAELHGAGWYGQ